MHKITSINWEEIDLSFNISTEKKKHLMEQGQEQDNCINII